MTAEDLAADGGAAAEAWDAAAAQNNVDALAHALLVCTELPWLLCLLCYSILHRTFPMDQRRVLKEDVHA